MIGRDLEANSVVVGRWELLDWEWRMPGGGAVGLTWHWYSEGTLCYCGVFKRFSLAPSVDVARSPLWILALGNEIQHSTGFFSYSAGRQW